MHIFIRKDAGILAVDAWRSHHVILEMDTLENVAFADKGVDYRISDKELSLLQLSRMGPSHP